MPLTNEQLRDRQFSLGGFLRLKEFLNGKFSKINEIGEDVKRIITDISRKTWKVEVENEIRIQNKTDYTVALTDISSGISQVGKLLEELKQKDPISVEKTEINLSEVVLQLLSVEKAIQSLKFPSFDLSKVIEQLKAVENQIAMIPQPQITIPKQDIVIPDTVSLRESQAILDKFTSLEQAFVRLPTLFPKEQQPIDFTVVLEALQQLKTSIEANKPPSIEFPERIEVSNFPPQHIPTPVTHVSINSLNGFIKTSAVTVTSSLTPLPSYGVLNNRRSLSVYNNSSNTIYLGGSDVTVSNGTPVAAGTHSPIYDAGVHMILYGIAATGSNDVRCIEISDESSGR